MAVSAVAVSSHQFVSRQEQVVEKLSPLLSQLACTIVQAQGATLRARVTEEAEQKALEQELQGLEEELKQQEVRMKQLEEAKAKLLKIVTIQISLTLQQKLQRAKAMGHTG